MDEHYLIQLLRGTAWPITELSFVAERDGEIAGHIVYTKSTAGGKPTITFGPLSVLPEYHRQGIGRALVEHSMNAAREMGFGAVVITGVPEYYPKLGFSRGRDFGISLPDGASPDALMVYELIPGYLSGGGAVGFEAAGIFEQAENDDAGFAVFHKQFMRESYPERLILRPLFDGDIALMERWLYAPHAAKWFEHPDDWLNEIRGRRDRFSFMHYFIAEYEGVPIGFCDYYDTHASQGYEEEWSAQWRVNERKGEVYGIDYLIGEKDYLRRGFGRDMILRLLDKIRQAGAKIVLAGIDRDNKASRRALEAAGFVRSGGEYVLELSENAPDQTESERNLRLCESAGYSRFREDMDSAGTASVRLEKCCAFKDIKAEMDTPAVRRIISYAAVDGTPEGTRREVELYQNSTGLNFYGYLQNGVTAAICGFEEHPDKIEIHLISVDETLRRKGIGSAMVRELQRIYNKPIEAETTDEAVGFYRKTGFSAESFADPTFGRKWMCALQV
jgi:predicted N-acetyltransferase YhbS